MVSQNTFSPRRFKHRQKSRPATWQVLARAVTSDGIQYLLDEIINSDSSKLWLGLLMAHFIDRHSAVDKFHMVLKGHPLQLEAKPCA